MPELESIFVEVTRPSEQNDDEHDRRKEKTKRRVVEEIDREPEDEAGVAPEPRTLMKKEQKRHQNQDPGWITRRLQDRVRVKGVGIAASDVSSKMGGRAIGTPGWD
jgi:hypothetical protein